MYNKIKLITDNTCDLPEEYIKENNIEELFLSYTMLGQEYQQSNALEIKEFYKKMREGHTTKTSQVPPDVAYKILEASILKGYDILYIGFSSGLSGTFNSVNIAYKQLAEKYPDTKIRIIDSLAASIGEGLLVHYAAKMINDNKSIDEIADWCETNKLHICHMFTVDDLMFLHRGGRVSKSVAVAGSILGIKPVLHVDDDGHLVPFSKVRGRKKSLETLVNVMEEKSVGFKNECVGISHGDCLEDALYVKKLVQNKFGIKDFIINFVGPVIGSHSGPGTIALFFLGDKR